MRNRHEVGCLLVCLHLWLAKSFSEIIRQQKGDVCASEGRSGYFHWNDTMQHLLLVDYVFENKIIATASSTKLSSVDIKSERLNSRFQLLQADNVAFRIDNATEEDYGEYKIILTYSNGDERELVGRLRDFIPGNFNITCDQNSTTCTCGNQNSSGRFTWVFHHASGRKEIFTNGSELKVTDLPKNWSFFCERHSDCQRSRCFNFTSDEKENRGNSSINIPGAIGGAVAVAVVVIAILISIVFFKTRNQAEYSNKIPMEELPDAKNEHGESAV